MAIPIPLNPLGNTSTTSPYFELTVTASANKMTYQFTPAWGTGGYCRVVDWGDGTSGDAPVSGAAFAHTYNAVGTYKIKIIGNCTSVIFGNSYTYAAMVTRCNFNWSALGTLTMGWNWFMYCENLTSMLTSLPSTVTVFGFMFYDTKKLRADVSGLVQGTANAGNIANMFNNAGVSVPGGVTGSVASFMRHFPKVTNVTNAFLRTACTPFSSTTVDYFEINTPIFAASTWGFTPTFRSGTWYVIDWGDGTTTDNKNLATGASGTRIEHTYESSSDYSIKIAMNASAVTFDSYDSDNGRWDMLGNPTHD